MLLILATMEAYLCIGNIALHRDWMNVAVLIYFISNHGDRT